MVTRLVRMVAAVALLALAGCSAPATAGTPTAASAPTAGGTAAVAEAAVGGLRIPAIGVDVEQLVPLALDKNRQPEVPSEDTPEVAGWYVLGSAPGDPGPIPAVILGHVGARGVPGVFARLHELQVGDRITVDHNGRPVDFVVYERQQASKTAFPTDAVYRTGGGLRLVTCGGELDTAEHSFKDNIIIYAKEP